MKARLVVVAAMTLVAAGCGGSAADSPAATAAPITTAPAAATAPAATESGATESAPTATTIPTPAPSVTAVSARVTFDGRKCVYTGPTVIPFPASLAVEYAPTDAEKDTMIGLIAIKSGTTMAQIEDPSNPAIGEGDPSFIYLDSHMFVTGGGTYEYRAVSDGSNPMAEPAAANGKPYDTYLVMCIPRIPGYPAGDQTILHVVVPGG